MEQNNNNNNLGDKVVADLHNDFVAVGKHHVHGWYSWAVVGVCLGVLIGIAYVANNTGKFVPSMASTVLSCPGTVPTIITASGDGYTSFNKVEWDDYVSYVTERSNSGYSRQGADLEILGKKDASDSEKAAAKERLGAATKIEAGIALAETGPKGAVETCKKNLAAKVAAVPTTESCPNDQSGAQCGLTSNPTDPATACAIVPGSGGIMPPRPASSGIGNGSVVTYKTTASGSQTVDLTCTANLNGGAPGNNANLPNEEDQGSFVPPIK